MGFDTFPRLGWVEASLRYAGAFGVNEKKAYRVRFALSEAAVSRDQDAFLMRLAETDGAGSVVKQRGRLAVIAKLPDAPLFELPSTGAWLAEVLGSRFEEVEAVQRSEPPAAILRPIVRAILARRLLSFDYHGRKGRTRREVSPHAVVHAAGRLHLRAWDHGRGAPRDFVMARILWAKLGEEAGFVDRVEDHEWSEWARIEVRAKPEEDAAAVRLDYALDPLIGDRVHHRVRRAHLIYLLDEGSGGVPAPVTVREVD